MTTVTRRVTKDAIVATIRSMRRFAGVLPKEYEDGEGVMAGKIVA